MGKKKRPARKRAARTPGEVTLTHDNVKELTTGMRKLLGLQAQRRQLAAKLRRLDDRIRDQRKFTRDILADPQPERAGNIGALDEGK